MVEAREIVGSLYKLPSLLPCLERCRETYYENSNSSTNSRTRCYYIRRLVKINLCFTHSKKDHLSGTNRLLHVGRSKGSSGKLFYKKLPSILACSTLFLLTMPSNYLFHKWGVVSCICLFSHKKIANSQCFYCFWLFFFFYY